MSDPNFSKHISAKLNNSTCVKCAQKCIFVVTVSKRLKQFVNHDAFGTW
jgi:hypothetical protein